MSFKYDLTANQQTPTSDSKVVLCKSFKIDIANGSGFLSGTTYDLGWLPKEAQVVGGQMYIPTTVSGGTISAATLVVKVNGASIFSAVNVYAAAQSGPNTAGYYTAGTGLATATSDQKIIYTPTLTGAGATAGVIYINIFYVV